MKKGYFSMSKKNNGKDKESSLLYEFDVPENLLNISKVIIAKGIVVDGENSKPVKAKIELVDLAKKERISLVESDEKNGSYVLTLTEGAEYAVYVSAQGYLFKSFTFNVTNCNNFDPMVLDVRLEKIKQGSHVVLNNIFFEFGKYDLQPKSIAELEKVKQFLLENKDVKVEISGHTDNIGKYEDNKILSELRAKAVVDYLIKSGISPERLTFVGYADKKPIASNDNEQGRSLNRRIEFRIL
jgi:outer membrane protein OmpA-like peptidoglycan-associated protein